MKENPENVGESYSAEEVKDWDFNFKDENVPFWMKKYSDHFEPTEHLEGENTVGVDMPKYLKNECGTKITH